jgi:pimeloyl-ACP methyl ester carboxylesterase
METTSEEKFVETTHGNIYYVSNIIRPNGPTVLLLHGLSSNHTTWNNMIKVFSEMGINTIAPDLRGHGHSDKTRIRKYYKLELAKEDLKLILEKEKIKSVHVIGYSWGGHIGIDLAISNPNLVKTLTLISTSHRNFFAYTPFAFVAPIGRAFVTLLGYLVIWQKRKKYHYFSQEMSRGYWESTFSGLATMPLSINFWMLTEVAGVNFKDSLKNISSPTHIFHGENDDFISMREIDDMAQKIPKSKVTIIKNSDHFLAGKYQNELIGYIIDFVKANL